MAKRFPAAALLPVSAALIAFYALPNFSTAQTAKITPGTLPRVGTIDERFQSYNIEMVEVTGGRFWKPYASTASSEPPAKTDTANQPAGMSPSLYEYRAPINLSVPRLRKLAAALGPAYVRVSGTWANTTWFQETEGPAPATPPDGFKAILTRAQWKGVLDFAKAANAEVVTSFSVGAGARDASGVWAPVQAAKLVYFTQANGGHIAASEFMNEPTFAVMGGAPSGYDPQAYARDFKVFEKFIKSASPSTLILGPGGVGEGTTLVPPGMKLLASADIMAATGPVFEAFSYHSYGGVSSRCAPAGTPSGTTPQAALSDDWLGRAEKIESFYAALRDQFEPGKPLWNTETAQTACGGDRWASTFLDSFRYLNQLGISAKRGVQVHMHNTLAASDYGLLDEKTYQPRPNYWAALAWRRLMGTTVLDPGPASAPGLRLYAHCLRNQPGGVALLAINANATASAKIDLSAASERYTLSAHELQDGTVLLNGAALALGPGDELPSFKGAPTSAGMVELAPASITCFAIEKADHAACR
jgi:heparanase 1